MQVFLKTPLKFGLMGTGIIVVMFFIFLLTGSNPLTEMRIFDFFVIPVFLFFGIKDYRDFQNSGLMEFWQGMTAGLVIYGTIAAVYSLFLWVALSFTPDLVSDYITESLRVMADTSDQLIDSMGQENYDTSYREVSKTTVADLVLDSLIKKSGIGFFLTSLIATILKRKQPTDIV